ncbi:hypothetical protein niasHT_028349 [Heterodera trifolii]|uniref:Uncharacterized protein n=1 Tax=Heterodera trifolii TaxID=157864 RepID=A0ABD2KSH9_9BILA
MGNVFALELAYHQHPPEQPSHPFWFYLAILFVCLIVCALLVIAFLLFRKFASRFQLFNRTPNAQPLEPERAHSPSAIPTVYVVFVLAFIIYLPITSGQPKGGSLKGIVKPVAKGSLPILGTSALYFGIDALFGKAESEASLHPVLTLFALLGLIVTILLLLFIKFFVGLRNRFRAPPSPNNSEALNALPPGSIELEEIRTVLNDLVSRADPPRTFRSNPPHA